MKPPRSDDPAVMAEAIELEEMIIIESNSAKIEIHNVITNRRPAGIKSSYFDK